MRMILLAPQVGLNLHPLVNSRAIRDQETV
jgi:hypothetical protein